MIIKAGVGQLVEEPLIQVKTPQAFTSNYMLNTKAARTGGQHTTTEAHALAFDGHKDFLLADGLGLECLLMYPQNFLLLAALRGIDAMLAGSEGGAVQIFDLQDGHLAATHPVAQDNVNGFSFHPYLPLAAVASGDQNQIASCPISAFNLDHALQLPASSSILPSLDVMQAAYISRTGGQLPSSKLPCS